MNILSIEDNEQNLYPVRVLLEACGAPAGIAEVETATTTGRRPRKEVS
jgi:hypothetical protein